MKQRAQRMKKFLSPPAAAATRRSLWPFANWFTEAPLWARGLAKAEAASEAAVEEEEEAGGVEEARAEAETGASSLLASEEKIGVVCEMIEN